MPYVKLIVLSVTVLVMAGASAMAAAEPVLNLHVAPDGDDAASGTRAQPFATLERARDEIRSIMQADGLPEGGAVVELAGGNYELDQPFELGADDSGAPGAPIVYRGKKGADVRLVGGKLVTDWQEVTDPAVLDRLEK